jgi:hypothetical protein
VYRWNAISRTEDGTAGIAPKATITKAKECGSHMDTTLPMRRANERAIGWLLLCGILSPLLLGIFVIVAGLVTPDFSFVSDSISQLGARGRPHPEVMNGGFMVCGVLINGFAHGLYWRLGRSGVAKMVWLLLTIQSVGVVLSGVFQVDFQVDSNALSAPSTLEGTLHCIFSQVAFFALLFGIALFAMIVYRNPAWRGFTQISLAIFVLNLVLLLVFLIGRAEPVDGVLQLSFFGISLVWLVAVSLRSLRLPRHPELQQDFDYSVA